MKFYLETGKIYKHCWKRDIPVRLLKVPLYYCSVGSPSSKAGVLVQSKSTTFLRELTKLYDKKFEHKKKKNC